MIYLLTIILAILPAVAVVYAWVAWVLPERQRSRVLADERKMLRERVADLTGQNRKLGRAYQEVLNERHRARLRIAELCREKLDHACNRPTVRP